MKDQNDTRGRRSSIAGPSALGFALLITAVQVQGSRAGSPHKYQAAQGDRAVAAPNKGAGIQAPSVFPPEMTCQDCMKATWVLSCGTAANSPIRAVVSGAKYVRSLTDNCLPDPVTSNCNRHDKNDLVSFSVIHSANNAEVSDQTLFEVHTAEGFWTGPNRREGITLSPFATYLIFAGGGVGSRDPGSAKFISIACKIG